MFLKVSKLGTSLCKGTVILNFKTYGLLCSIHLLRESPCFPKTSLCAIRKSCRWWDMGLEISPL